MVLLESFFLILFWSWVFCGVLFLRNTILPRLPITATPAALNLPFADVRFAASDGLPLAGWTIAAEAQRPWLILCHGLGANRADLLEIGAGLFGAGYNLLAFDFRAHGESGGRTTSFGWLEQRDLEGALAFLGAQPEIPDHPYGILGISMGGAVAIMVAARDERLGAVIADSPYANLEESITHHLKLMYRLPKVPFGWFATTAYRLRFGAWPGQMAPLAEIAKLSPRPVFIIQGEQDPRMPLAEAQALADAAKDPKEFWVVRGTDHLTTFADNPSGYLQRVVRFFDTYLKP
ncbi:MAG: alpha/beta hydrolase [candidate division NC10 bacterium]